VSDTQTDERSTDSMTASTSSWDTVTTPAGTAPRPSSIALATRSLSAVGRLTGDARREALQDHFASFPPSVGSSCAVRH